MHSQKVFRDMVPKKYLIGERLQGCLNGIYYAFLLALASRLLFFTTAWIFNIFFDMGKTPTTLFCSWDCGWYMGIINNGYALEAAAHAAGDAANWAFFPLFPLISRYFMIMSGLSASLSAVIVSNTAFVLFIVVLFTYCKDVFGARIAKFAVATMAFSPYSVYFSAPYTEGLYVLLMILTLYCAKEGRWLSAGAFAALLSATRNLGVFIVFPLFIMGLHRYGWKKLLRLSSGTERFWLCILLVPLGLSLYMLFLHQLMGDALAFKHVQIAWGRTIGNPLAVLFSELLHGSGYAKYCATAACISFGAALFLAWKRFLVESSLLFFGTIVPLAAGVLSLPRFVFTLFPIYVVLGLVSSRSQLMRVLLMSCICTFNGFMILSWIAGKWYMV